MAKIVGFFKTKKIGYYFLLPAFVSALAGLVLYLRTGVTIFTPTLSDSVIISLAIGLFLNAVLFVFEIKTLKYGLYLLFLYSCLSFLASQATYIANVLVSIDGTTFSSSFIAEALLLALAWIFALISAILMPYRTFGSRKSSQKEAHL